MKKGCDPHVEPESNPSRSKQDGRPRDYGRRDLLRAGAAFGLGLGLAAAPSLVGCSEDPTDRQSSGVAGAAPVMPRGVTLGRTGLEVPDIGFGTFALECDAELVRFALDRGITQFDTAEGYTEGRAEEVLGRAFEGDRNRVTITTKVVASSEATADSMMKRLETSLRRLRTDRVDIYLNHAVDSPDRMSNPGWSEFVARAKQQGKIRFSEMSGHAPSLVACLDAALAAGQLDVILVGYTTTPRARTSSTPRRRGCSIEWVKSIGWRSNRACRVFPSEPGPRGVGVMAMKTLRGARSNDMRPFERSGATFAQAALRWVLSDDRVDAAIRALSLSAHARLADASARRDDGSA